MRLKLLNRIRALETSSTNKYVPADIRIVFVSASGSRSCEYRLQRGRLIAFSSASNESGIASDNAS